MKFGIFYEHQLPRPWDPDSEHRVIKEALEQVELADRLGFDTRVGGRAPLPRGVQPLVRARGVPRRRQPAHHRTSASATASSPLPPGYNHPARVAERIATLDLVSDGRVEFGTGETSSDMELAGFEIDRDDEARDVGGGGRRDHDDDARRSLPRPRRQALLDARPQRGAEAAAAAASTPVGGLFSARDDPDGGRARHRRARRSRSSAPTRRVSGPTTTTPRSRQSSDPIGYDVNPNLAVVTGFMCHEDEQTAIDRGLDGFHFFAYSLSHYYVFGSHTPGVTDVYAGVRGEARGVRLRQAQGPGRGTRSDRRRARRGSIRFAERSAHPTRSARSCAAYEAAGVDQVIFISQAGKNKHEDICESLELFAREVMPEFKEREPEIARRKAERLAPTVERLRALKPMPTELPSLVIAANPAL